MRYALAMLMALVLGGSAMIQAASAADREGPQAPSFSTITAQYGPSDPGSIAGPTSPWYHTPAVDHDRN